MHVICHVHGLVKCTLCLCRDESRAQESSTVLIKQENESVETHCRSSHSNHNSDEIEVMEYLLIAHCMVFITV